MEPVQQKKPVSSFSIPCYSSLSFQRKGRRMGGNKRNLNVNVLQVPLEVVQVCLATVIQS